MQAGQPAALALPVADRILDELERRVLAEVADREDRLEDRLQAGVLALRGQPVHLQEPLVRLLLDLDQVRDRNRGLDLRKVDALAVDVLGKAVHAGENLEVTRDHVARDVRRSARRDASADQMASRTRAGPAAPRLALGDPRSREPQALT